VVPDIRHDPRFLDRTAARKAESGTRIAFICVPLRVEGEMVGALSVDRPYASQAALEKDLRLLKIVASAVSQVLKINRMVRIEKEEILARDEKLIQELRSRYRLEKVAGQSEAIRKVLATAAMAAKSDASVLISGETGTGKELIANVVHFNSGRAKGPFIKVNCGALTETLLESELFGHVKGSFTGAIRDRRGRFELADGGTLFLDEVADMSPGLQLKILRVLQEMEFEPVGGTQTVHVDVRVVAASNKDLKKGIREGWFRQDLYYRLNVIPIQLPPLRARREDIPLLVNHFLDIYNKKNAKLVGKISRDVLDLLVRYDWPGNARELENCVEHAVVMSPGETFTRELLPQELVERKHRAGAPMGMDEVRAAIERFCGTADNPGEAMRQLTQTVERAAIQKALSLGLSQRELAQKLGISRMTLSKKMKELGIK
jgi:Nif-specific regulatory protein